MDNAQVRATSEAAREQTREALKQFVQRIAPCPHCYEEKTFPCRTGMPGMRGRKLYRNSSGLQLHVDRYGAALEAGRTIWVEHMFGRLYELSFDKHGPVLPVYAHVLRHMRDYVRTYDVKRTY